MLIGPRANVVAHRSARPSKLPFAARMQSIQLRRSTLEMFPAPPSETPSPTPSDAAILAAARAAYSARVPVAKEIDQCHLTVDSLATRIRTIAWSRPLRASRIAFVGDDDMASVALAHLSPPAATLVLDVDQRVLDGILHSFQGIDEARNLLALQHVDLSSKIWREEISSHEESFDIVVSDPPYASDGMERFVEVAMTMCAFTGELHLAVPALLGEAWTDDLLHSVQRQLIASGFVIDQLIPGAFGYEGDDVISSLIIARRLPGSIVHSAPVQPLGRFYTTRHGVEQGKSDVSTEEHLVS